MPKPGGEIWVKAIAEDGTFGLGRTDSGHATQPIIAECLAPLVVGQEVGAIDRCNDRMWRGTLSFGNEGLTARAVAGVDLALWGPVGAKTLDQPVYRLAGGPAADPDGSLCHWQTMSIGTWSWALKSSSWARPAPDPLMGKPESTVRSKLMGQVSRVNRSRPRDLMLDCWMTFDLDFCRAQSARRSGRIGLRWMEEMLMPHDWEGTPRPAPARFLGRRWPTASTGPRAIPA